MKYHALAAALALSAQAAPLVAQSQTQAQQSSARPTIVLVHGGFVDGSGWQGVFGILRKDGYNVVETKGSHALYVSLPAPVAEVIKQAATKITKTASR